MKSAFILASPNVRARLRRRRLHLRLRKMSDELERPEDLGYLHLAEALLTGIDHRDLPEDEKVGSHERCAAEV